MVSSNLRYEIGPIRPPSEAYSLLVRFTRFCPWNKCEFCSLYKGRKFERRSLAEIKADIDAIKAIRDEIEALSRQRGESGKLSRNLVQEICSSPAFNDCFRSVAIWIYFGGAHVFIQDANSLVLKPHDLIEAIGYLRETFPSVDRITSYGRSQTVSQLWSVENLRRLKDSGLTRLHLGLETGDDLLLKYMAKGVTKAQHIVAGQRIREAGIELSEYVILGLGGERWWRQHALESADALNQINPDFIRLRTFTAMQGMPLYSKIESGDFVRLHDDGIVREIRLFIERLNGIASYVISDHMLNLLEEVEGRLPQDKQKILGVIDRYFALAPEERLVYRMGRKAGIYRSTGDLNEAGSYGRIRNAIREMERREPGSVERELTAMTERDM